MSWVFNEICALNSKAEEPIIILMEIAKVVFKGSFRGISAENVDQGKIRKLPSVLGFLFADKG